MPQPNDTIAARSVTDLHMQQDHTQLGNQKLWMKWSLGICLKDTAAELWHKIFGKEFQQCSPLRGKGFTNQPLWIMSQETWSPCFIWLQLSCSETGQQVSIPRRKSQKKRKKKGWCMCKVQLTTDEEKTLQVGRTLAGSRVRRPFQKIDKSGWGLKKKKKSSFLGEDISLG